MAVSTTHKDIHDFCLHPARYIFQEMQWCRGKKREERKNTRKKRFPKRKHFYYILIGAVIDRRTFFFGKWQMILD